MSLAGDTGRRLGPEELERNLRVLRAVLFGTAPGELTRERIEDVTRTYLGAVLSSTQQSQVVERWLADRYELEPATMLRRRGGPRPWFSSYNPDEGYHWRRLREYLITVKGRSESVVDDLDLTTNRILEMLEDPRAGGPDRFRVQGLVVGYIQSGKTANFSALIAKAYDVGYRIVIVLSGLHNSLRRQTQLRLEDELGLIDATPGRPAVGRAEDTQQISRMTRPETWGDFNQGTADSSLLSSGARTILVIKKNASVLRRLDAWLRDREPITSPVLVIDDEADQASINTGGNRNPLTGAVDEETGLDEFTDLDAADVDTRVGTTGGATAAAETDPSVINGLIRGLLDRMRRVSYVGYTATPFANVLIGHDYRDRDVGEELYPSDFLMSLKRPPGYVGPERLFGRAALAGEGGQQVQGVDVLRIVPEYDADALLPRRGFPDALPPSLGTALDDFVLALAARDVRRGGQPAGCMLVHASQYVAQQDALSGLLRERLAFLRHRWRYDRESVRDELRRRWIEEFVPVTEDLQPGSAMAFEDIEDALTSLFRRELPVLVLHNRSPDELDYEHDPDLRAVVVGGNKLSRGLTLEGLLVSYYVRRANYYDTLLQMGRWFGYREDYVDLTRLYTTRQLIDNFRDLATYEEELRREIRLYEQLGMTPADFGPRIRVHPAMQITAPNRMGSARRIAYNYSATLQQTITFKLDDPRWLRANLQATRRFLAALGPPNSSDLEAGRPTWTGVDWRAIEQFLGEYQTHPDSTRFVAANVRDYLVAQAGRYGELVRWTVAVRSLLTPEDRLGTEDLGITGQPVNRISRSREKDSSTSIGTLVNPSSKNGRGDEDVGLDDQARQRAVRMLGEHETANFPLALRRQRDPGEGLLLIYPISPHSQARQGDDDPNKQPLFTNPDDTLTVIGIAASFPYSRSPAADGGYVVGSAGPAPV